MMDGSRHSTRKGILSAGTIVGALALGGCGPLKPINFNLKPVNLSFNLSCGPLGAAIDAACDKDDAATVQAKEKEALQAEVAVERFERKQPVVINVPDLANGPAILSESLSSKLAGAPMGETIPRRQSGGPMSIADAVRGAIRSSTQLGLAVASRSESEAGVDAARAGYRPNIDISSGSGQNTFGTLIKSSANDYFSRANTSGAWRNDFKLNGTMMVYDFGAVDADVARAMSERDAAALRETAASEEAAFSAAQLYIQVLQNRELLTLAEENLTALKTIARLIASNVQNGNATQADTQRVEARVLDAESARADQQLALKAATERFIRIVNMTPGELRQPPAYDNALPPTVERALEEAIRKNPMIVANAAVVAAARAEVAAFKSTQKPRLTVDTSAQSKTYRGVSNKTELDLSAMLSLSYKLADGGLSNSKADQATARLTQAQIRDLDTRESLETDLRQQFLQYASSKAKRDGLIAGVKSSASARELYQEQFIGGKRSLLELLEVQSAYYGARFNFIVNSSDLRLATFAILRSTGRLSATILSAR